jgi:PAS domain S-box-containing protein
VPADEPRDLNNPFACRFTLVFCVAACTAFAVVFTGLCGWGFGIVAFQRLVPGWPAARPIALCSLFLLSAALSVTDRPGKGPFWASLLSFVVLIGALVSLPFYPDMPPDRWFSLPPPASSLSLVALAVAAILLQRERPVMPLVVAAAIFALGMPLQRMSAIPWLGSTAPTAGLGLMPLPTALFVIALDVGAILLNPKLALFDRLVARSAEGRSLRFLIVVAVIGPIAVTGGALFSHYQHGVDILDLSTLLLVVTSAAGIGAALAAIEAKAHSAAHASKSADQFAILLDQAPTAYLLVDSDGRINSANRAASDLFGWARHELEVMNVDQLVPKTVRHDHARLRESFVVEGGSRAMGAGRDVYGERRNGDLVPLEIALTPIDMSDRNLVLVSLVDISIRRRIEGLQDWQKAIVTSSVDAIISESLDGTIQSVNASAERIFGFTADELIGRNSMMLVPEDRRAEEALILGRIESGEAIAAFETSRCRRDGTTIAVSMAVSPVRNSTGRVVGISRIARDITDLVQLVGDLAASEARFREVANSVPQMMWTSDARGYPDFLSDKWAEYTGRSAAELTAGVLRGMLHPDDREVAREEWKRAVDGGVPLSLEIRLRRFDGEWRWFDTRALPLRDRDGRITKWFGSNTDVQERRDMLAAAQAYARDLERSNTELEQFAYAASHDLQEPLRMITSYTQLIERRYSARLDDDGRHMFGYVVDGARRMQRLIDDLLVYSRLRQPMAADSRCEVAAAIIHVRRLLLDRIAATEAELIVTPDLPAMRISPVAANQLFQNLIGNALRYRSDAPPRIEIGVSDVTDGFARFFVRDNGIGIEPRFHEKVFQIFQRLKRGHDGDPGGTGIGLALCRRIVENVGGTIGIESDGRSGTTFHFTVPILEEGSDGV